MGKTPGKKKEQLEVMLENAINEQYLSKSREINVEVLKYVKEILCVGKQIAENFKQILGLVLRKLFLVVRAAKQWGSLEIPNKKDF